MLNQQYLYDDITKRILESIEKGVTPWKQPWANMSNSHNPISGTNYKGINILLMNLHQSDFGLKSNLYGTALQWNGKKCKIKKGSTGCPIYFWNMLKKTKDLPDGSQKETTFPLLKRFTAFNVYQIEGYYADQLIEEQKKKIANGNNIGNHEEAERVLSASEAPIIYGGDEALYSPSTDEIHMPNREQFSSIASFYQTAFHELIHSTGKADRCNRVAKWNRFGSEAYAAEELVAEIGGCYLAKSVGIEDADVEKNSASYLKTWLIKALKDDSRLIVQASGAASVASEYCLGRAKLSLKEKVNV